MDGHGHDFGHEHGLSHDLGHLRSHGCPPISDLKVTLSQIRNGYFILTSINLDKNS